MSGQYKILKKKEYKAKREKVESDRYYKKDDLAFFSDFQVLYLKCLEDGVVYFLSMENISTFSFSDNHIYAISIVKETYLELILPPWQKLYFKSGSFQALFLDEKIDLQLEFEDNLHYGDIDFFVNNSYVEIGNFISNFSSFTHLHPIQYDRFNIANSFNMEIVKEPNDYTMRLYYTFSSLEFRNYVEKLTGFKILDTFQSSNSPKLIHLTPGSYELLFDKEQKNKSTAGHNRLDIAYCLKSENEEEDDKDQNPLTFMIDGEMKFSYRPKRNCLFIAYCLKECQTFFHYIGKKSQINSTILFISFNVI